VAGRGTASRSKVSWPRLRPAAVGAVVAGHPVQQVKEVFGELRRASRVPMVPESWTARLPLRWMSANFLEQAGAEVVFKAGLVDEVGEFTGVVGGPQVAVVLRTAI
jgi:hypothetical protein